MRIPRTIGIENVAVVSGEVEPTFEKYERMGFKLTPVSAHFEGKDRHTRHANRNRYAMFERRSYYEVLNVSIDGLPDAGYGWRLKKWGGHLGKIMFAFDDIQALKAHFVEKSYAFAPDYTRMTRVWTSAETGAEHVVPMDVMGLPDDLCPGFFNAVLKHLAPEENYVADYLVHPNTALGIAGNLVCVDEVAKAADGYAAVLGTSYELAGGEARFAFANGSRLVFVRPEDARRYLGNIGIPRTPYLAATFFWAGDLVRTAEVLRSNGVAFERRDGRLVVDPREGANAVCIFEAAR
ncbi:MAG: VOC family protein [Sphingomonadales bacterium]|nr:VOC family protein [Sphingomonadales bacterium]